MMITGHSRNNSFYQHPLYAKQRALTIGASIESRIVYHGSGNSQLRLHISKCPAYKAVDLYTLVLKFSLIQRVIIFYGAHRIINKDISN